MIEEQFDVLDHLLLLAIVENSLNTFHELESSGLLVEAHVVVEVLHQCVRHRGVVLAGSVHQEHRRLNEHDAVREAGVVADPVEEDGLKNPGLVNEVSLLLYQVAYHHEPLEDF